MKIVIIGAGVAGGVIARGLRRVPGVRVELVERVSAEDHLMAGNGLNVGPNALKALDLVLPKVAAELRRASLPWTRWHTELSDGTRLYEIPLADVAEGPGIRIRWSELYRIARQPVADLTRYDRAFVGLDVAPDGRAALTVEGVDGLDRETLRDVDLVIAGDGRYSRVRELLCGRPSIRHLGVANFRLLIDDRGASRIEDLSEWYTGPARLLAFRLADGRIYLSGNFPIEPGREIAEHEKTAAFIRATYLPAVGPVLPICRYLVDAACHPASTLHWARNQEIDVRFHDAGGHPVLFVGDSAHAMAPTLGQGATQAIEDGCAFVALFRTWYERRDVDVTALLAAYDRLRRERIEFVRRLSWDASAPLLLGSDPMTDNRYKGEAGYRADLRRMYCDLGFAADETVAV